MFAYICTPPVFDDGTCTVSATFDAVLLQIYKKSSQQNDANRYHIHSD